MQKYLLGFLLLFALNCFSQDTLYFKNSTIKIVQIVGLNQSQGLLLYLENGDTSFASLSALERYSSQNETIKSVTEIEVNKPVDIVPSEVAIPKQHREKSTFHKKESGFTNAPFNVGLNLTGPISARTSEITATSNAYFGFYGEYLPHPLIGLALELKVGLGRSNLTIGSGTNITDFDRDLIFEFGFNPTLYMGKQKKYSLFLKPGLHFGQNHGINIAIYKTYSGSYPYPTTTYQYPEFKRNFIRISTSIGLQLNLWKNISIAGEFGLFGSNYEKHERLHYSNSTSQPTPIFTSSELRREIKIGGQGALYLIYRFGENKK